MTDITMVQVSIKRVAHDGVRFDLATLDYQSVASDITYEELQDGVRDNNWRVFDSIDMNYTPSDVPTVSPEVCRAEMQKLQLMKAQLSALREEYGMSTGARFKELDSNDGPIRNLQRDLNVVQASVQCLIRDVFGVWPREMHSFGL